MAKINTVRILVMDECFSDTEYDKWDNEFMILDCEFSDFIPNDRLKPEFVEFVAQKHSIESSSFDAIQSIA